MRVAARVEIGVVGAIAALWIAAQAAAVLGHAPGRALTASEAAQVYGGQTGGGCNYYVTGNSMYCTGVNYDGCGDGMCSTSTGPNKAAPPGTQSLMQIDCSQKICDAEMFKCGENMAWLAGCS